MPERSTLLNYVYHHYSEFREDTLQFGAIKHRHILPLLENAKSEPLFTVFEIGVSTLGRKLHLVKIGSGEKKLFFWSQMHGDEATATGSMFDVINFFKRKNHHFRVEKEEVLNRCSLFFFPMVNPDGAEFVTRENALGIDINRDARKLSSIEGSLLMKLFREITPTYAFNLHDQSHLYNCGTTAKQAMFAFLAPVPSLNKEMTENRKRAIQLIQTLFHTIEDYFPGHSSRYSDDFEPRAFGDTFQSLNVPTILIESGGWKDDKDKLVIRQMHTLLLIESIFAIASNRLAPFSLTAYEAIPENTKKIFDLILRGVSVCSASIKTVVDIAINKPVTQRGFLNGVVEIGDLGGYFGVQELDCGELTAVVQAEDSSITAQAQRTPKLGDAALILLDKAGTPVYSVSYDQILRIQHKRKSARK